MTRIYLAAGAFAFLVTAALWLRWEAVQQDRLVQRARAADQRLDDIKASKESRDEATRLTDDDLLNALGRWVLPSKSD
jgi:urease accessory protein UreF